MHPCLVHSTNQLLRLYSSSVYFFTYKAKGDVTFYHVFIFDNSVPNPFKQHYQKAVNIGHCRGPSEFQAVFLSDARE